MSIKDYDPTSPLPFFLGAGVIVVWAIVVGLVFISLSNP